VRGMEILSTGEKIKRARIYKGITLKELCDENISISKMSCIENGKVKAEPWIIEIVAQKLDLDVSYLNEDVRDQLENNLEAFKKRSKDYEYEEDLKLSISYAIHYGYNDLAFEFMHLLFTYYLDELKYNDIQGMMNEYYDISQKLGDKAVTFYRDMAKYFFNNKEFNEALAYYSKLRISSNDINQEYIADIMYSEARCYLKLKQDDLAYDLLKKYIDSFEKIDDVIIKGKVLSLYAGLLIRFGEIDGEDTRSKALVYLKEDQRELAKAKLFYGECYFKNSEREKGIKEVKEAMDMFPKERNDYFCELLNKAVAIYIENGELEIADEIASEALNIAIGCDNVRLIERSYYLKASVFQKKGLYEQSEMYMNLSIDSLVKFGNHSQRYTRYIEMANMYHEIGEVREAIKYFTLAMNIEKRL
jgi:tetratricopeptide (TPR) repeat protein